MEPKFKYLLSPENVYILDFGDFQAQIKGEDIMARLYREFKLEEMLKEVDGSQSSEKG
jgi:hypothetical protein